MAWPHHVTLAPTWTVFALITCLTSLLFAFHVYLVSVGRTTKEQITKAWREEKGNPFHRGAGQNWAVLCCGPEGDDPSGGTELVPLQATPKAAASREGQAYKAMTHLPELARDSPHARVLPDAVIPELQCA